MSTTAEQKRLLAHRQGEADWQQWGPYLSERAWGTVREDYSPQGTAWDYLPHDHARSRAYRWNEDGLAGICDRRQYLCFALALWNGRDPILKERLFGLTGPEGNHGEDVKEYYFYLDNNPTHSYMKMLYKYPQAAFPYAELVAENSRRGFHDYEYELLDTGIFAQNRYFDVFIEYAKAGPDDILIRLSAVNRGPETAVLHLLPTLWFRNTWAWGYDNGPMQDVAGKPRLYRSGDAGSNRVVRADHPITGSYYLYVEKRVDLLFTENETNQSRLFGVDSYNRYTKDSFHRYLINGKNEAVNPDQSGTKCAALFTADIAPGETVTLRLRLTTAEMKRPFTQFNPIFEQRQAETDEFYAALHPESLSNEEKRVQRQALAGMLWSKQLYYYDVEQWLAGDPAGPTPPSERRRGRNRDWQHLNNFDIISMPDKWEYPWYAVWDLAFHCLPLALVDADFAKRQLILMTREWYMHPNGQLPAYEWALGDVNPPVHAWAAWRVYKIDAKQSGSPDRAFLEAIFHKLLLNFTWWVNRKDKDDNNVFQGGFLGLDNISLFDRSAALPTGGHIDQADGTAWMAFFSLEMMRMALELAQENAVYEDMATKFFEHFLAIARAMSQGYEGQGLWDEEDGFFYDVLHLPDDSIRPLKVRSLVGLIPLLAVETLDADLLEKVPDFRRRMGWFLQHRPHLSGNITCSWNEESGQEQHIMGIVTPERLRRVLRYLFAEDEFLSPYGIRSLSKVHETPYRVTFGQETFDISYQPAESTSGLFGGNSNWRGPVWFPINHLLIEALQRHHHYYGDEFQIEFPTGSGQQFSLGQIANKLSRRLIALFLPQADGRRPVYGGADIFHQDLHWRDLILFYEYFHGDNGAGLGASHQTGWTGLVAKLLQQHSADDK